MKQVKGIVRHVRQGRVSEKRHKEAILGLFLGKGEFVNWKTSRPKEQHGAVRELQIAKCGGRAIECVGEKQELKLFKKAEAMPRAWTA